MNKLNWNWHLSAATLTLFIYAGIGRFVQLPDFLMGFCLGLTLVLYPFGIYKLAKANRQLKA